jgi:DNA (cytosine-5)-methyltransferase 1
MSLTLVDFFCGAGGSSQGATAVHGVTARLACNHWDRAIQSHARNFPDTDHYQGDIHDADVTRFPRGDLFWASPECPKWSNARGKTRDFDKQPDLFGETLPDAATDRSRALMWDVPVYLAAMKRRGRAVLAGVVENVVDVRAWNLWDAWVGEIRNLGYRTRLVAINSMHAQPRVTAPAPQSRDRLYLAYWSTSLGRDPDWNRWLRPRAWCPTCGQHVRALQVFKQRGRDMGRYRQQYVYRCPHVACRNRIVEPAVLPAAVAIDWSLPGQRIGDRATPLAAKTLARIEAGLRRYAQPTNQTTTVAGSAMLVPAGGTWRSEAVPVGEPMPTRTTRENDGLAWLPFIAELRGGSSDARPVSDALSTVTASGNHHGLVTAAGTPSIVWNNAARGGQEPGEHLLIPYYGTGIAKQVTEPVGTLSTRDRYGLASSEVLAEIDVNDVLFRMLEPHEIGRAMSFADSYVVLGNKREKVRQYGNAVTPPVAEVLISALVEAITGEEIPT